MDVNLDIGLDIATELAALLSGFSIVSSLILLASYWFFLPLMKKTLLSKAVCAVVLVGLALLQISHFYYFQTGEDILYTRGYVSLLMIVPLSFYFFSRIVLFQEERIHLIQFAHFLPLCISFFLSVKLVPTLAFTLGTIYTFWLALRLYSLKEERSRFVVEIMFFSMFSIMAIIALLLGLFLPFIDSEWFYLAYSLSISIAMVSVVSALLIFPQLLEDVVAITERAYTSSKLLNIDTEVKLHQLQRLMEEKQVFTDEEISLAKVAKLMELTSHQLSELINANYGKNFPRLVREYRVEATKRQLIAEPKTSMLVIGLQAGFKSQSAFYTAFKEITDMSPGAFRKIKLTEQ